MLVELQIDIIELHARTATDAARGCAGSAALPVKTLVKTPVKTLVKTLVKTPVKTPVKMSGHESDLRDVVLSGAPENLEKSSRLD